MKLKSRIVLALPALVMGISMSAVSQPDFSEMKVTYPPGFENFGPLKPGTIETVPLSEAPISEAERDLLMEDKSHQRAEGWTAASRERTSELDKAFSEEVASFRKKSLQDALPHLKVAPTSLVGTVLEDSRVFGVLSSGALQDGYWTGLTRLLESPRFGRVLLEEMDYKLSGSHMKVAEEMVDFSVRGFPGISTVWRDRTGLEVTELEWYSERKYFRLVLEGSITDRDEEYGKLLELADVLD
ncbi:MAG: hypothetical protein Cons2KO_33280 [Congregibacter sp.]